VFALDVDWRFTYVNPAAARKFDIVPDKLIGQVIWSLFPEAVGSDAYRQYHHALTTGESVKFETFCDVLHIWARERVYPSQDGLTVCFTDMTAERQTREQQNALFTEQEERYRMVADYTCDLEYWLDPDYTLKYISPSSERITGYPAADFLADPMLLERIIHPEDRRRVWRHFQQEMKSFETFDLDFRIIHRDGGVRWINHVCRPVYGADGAFRGRRGSNRDITRRKNMETELERERALQTAVLDQLPVGVLIAEVPSGRVIRGNARMAHIVRHPVPNTEHSCNIQAFHPNGAPYDAEEMPLARVIADGETILNEEVHIQTEDGSSRVTLVSALPVHNRAGKAIAAVLVSHDVTAIKEIDHAKDEFLAILSHELKTPLTSILGWSEFALNQASGEHLDQAMAIVYRNARRQQRLIDELLDMSRLQHRRMDCVMAPADLGRLTCQAVGRAMDAAEKAGVTLTLSPFCRALPIFADVSRLAVCIDHLLSNGIKFTPSGGTVSVSCRQAGGKVVLIVRDTGRGITPDVLPTVFTPFLQVDRDEAVGGLGLGLAIVRGVVELHHGRVMADSPGPGQGSMFSLELPLYANGKAT